MTIEEKINNINTTSELQKLENGTAKDFDELWNKVISPTLPSEQAVRGWHKLLMEYVKKEDAVFFIRAFGSYNSKTKDETILRRGFYNKTNNNFSVFYGDNFFTSYFYSMAYDNYVPKLEEFEKAMHSRRFPCGFIQTKIEKQYAAYIKGKNPNISKKGYKIAHLYSSGENYNSSSPYTTINNFCNSVFPRGTNSDWKTGAEDEYGYYNYRFVDFESDQKAEDAKKFLIAHFIRTVHPINYFLVPNKPNRKDKKTGIKKTNIYWYDGDNEKDEIGENNELIAYVEKKIRKKYGDIYEEFLSLIYPNEIKGEGLNKIINASYGIGVWKTKIGVSTDRGTESTKVKREKKYTEQKRLEIAYYFLSHNTTYKYIDCNVLKCETDRHGGTSFNILKALGITSLKKNILSKTDIDSEIAIAEGKYKETLIRIKNNILIK